MAFVVWQRSILRLDVATLARELRVRAPPIHAVRTVRAGCLTVS